MSRILTTLLDGKNFFVPYSRGRKLDLENNCRMVKERQFRGLGQNYKMHFLTVFLNLIKISFSS